MTDRFRAAWNLGAPWSEKYIRPAVFLMTNTLETGGSERQFVTIANALDGSEFSVTLGCLKQIGPFLSQVSGLNEFQAGGSLFGVQSWRSRFALSRLLKKQWIGVAQSFDFYSNLMLIPAARFAGVPVVVGSQRQLGDLLTSRQFHVQNALFRLCDHVVCNSRAAAERLREAGIPKQKLAVIPNGVPDEFFVAVPPALPHEPQLIRIGMVSRMNDPAKRHDLFLRVAARLMPRFPQLRFVLIGDGPLRPHLEDLVRQSGLRDRVVFLGDQRDVRALLAALDISVLPSSSESLSNVILESMAVGVPVVAAEVGGNPELVQNGETGFLFSPGEEGQFVAALETLVIDPELRKRCGARARERALREYTTARARDQYRALYSALLTEKGWPPSAFLCKRPTVRTD